MADHRPIVSFVGLGAQKAGTTWLFRCLEEHPELRGAKRSNNKELNFFNLHWEFGLDWYDQQFEPDGRLCGEFSPQYLPSPGVAERMARYNPDLRLVVALREPIDRAVSQHRHLIRAGLIDAATTFGQAVTTNPSYLDQGRYTSLLRPYYDHFRPDQIHVIFYDHIKARPDDVVAAAYDFLGVDPDFVPYSLREIVNPSTDPRHRGIDVLWRTAAPKAKRMLGPRRIGQIRRLGLARLLRRISGHQVRPVDATLTRDRLEEMRAELIEDNRGLADLLDLPVPDWSTEQAPNDHSE